MNEVLDPVCGINGVPSLSVLDGWWLEGHVEGITGWSIGRSDAGASADDGRTDAEDLYAKLERDVLPTYYRDRSKWLMIMKHSIALNASFFNTHRMVRQYQLHAYTLEPRALPSV